jgi:hypothetical protein
VPRLRPRTWGKLTLGVLVIGGTVAVLWAISPPTLDPTVEPEPRVAPRPLRAAAAVVVVRRAGSARELHARISCDGARRRASGFWRDPIRACDALASTRATLLSGPGCPARRRDRTALRATGRFGARRFDHRAEQLGCPSVRGWLGVNALASPVLVPERAATEAAGDRPGAGR